MKVNIVFKSDFFNPEQTSYCLNNPLLVEWEYPVLPSEGDIIDDYLIYKLVPEDYCDISGTHDLTGLAYHVDYIKWTCLDRGDGEILPTMYFAGG